MNMCVCASEHPSAGTDRGDGCCDLCGKKLSRIVEVKITRDDLKEALVWYAAQKSGTKYPLKHNTKLNGTLMLMGSDDSELFCTVTLEHLENVVPLKGKGR